MTHPFRVEPAVPVSAMQTYEIRRVPGVHTRKASCEEVDCEFFLKGWQTVVDVSTELGPRQASYIMHRAGRAYSMRQEGDLITFSFLPGQQCFAGHEVSTEREPLYVVRGGDHRGNPDGMRRLHKRGEDWVEDFGEHLQTVRDQREKG